METADLFGKIKPVIDRPLIAYAFLAQTNPDSGDLLLGLAPIFKPIARDWAGQTFDPKQFAQRVEDLYQISIHPWAVDDLARRMEKVGLLIKTQETRHAVSYSYAPIDDEFNEVAEADVRLVVQRFIDYAHPLCANHDLTLDNSQLEEAFFKQLISMDFHAALLRPKQPAQGNTIRLPTKKAGDSEHDQDPQKKSLAILCAGFIMSMFQNELAIYDLILRIATGAMVAEAVLNIQSPGSSANLNQLKVILDSPLVMRLLDLDEPSARDYARTLCEQLVAHGATLQVFRHSVDEMREAIDATVESWERSQGKGVLARRLGGRTYRQYVSSLRNDIEGELRRQNISTVSVPSTKDSYAFFSGDDEEAIFSELGHYDNALARERDAASIAAVMRLRRGRRVSMSQVHFSQYIFITSNPRVAGAAQDYTVRLKLLSESEVSPAFTDRYMASLLFVMFGGQGKEITHYQLLANCTAALEPQSEIIVSMHRFLSELDPMRADHFRAIMTDDRASQHLMQLTLGEVCFTSSDDAAALLNALQERYDTEARSRYDQQLAEVKQAGSEQLAQQATEHQKELRAERERLDRLQAEIEAAKRSRAQDRLELDSANHQTERLSTEVKDLMRVRRLDVRRRLEDAVAYGNRYGEFRHREITAGFVLVLFFITLLGSGLVFDSRIIMALSALAVSILGGFAFYQNPEKLFGEHIVQRRRKKFEERARELHVDPDDSAFGIDLKNGTVVDLEKQDAQ